ncbi:hypothetical protein FZ938_11190 [Azospirillum oryzae]|nr:hypothetical protein FZ938_11190 [Azospirillum oryzae]
MWSAGCWCPLPNPPPLTRERELRRFAIQFTPTSILPPLPRSGGGMGRGHSAPPQSASVRQVSPNVSAVFATADRQTSARSAGIDTEKRRT